MSVQWDDPYGEAHKAAFTVAKALPLEIQERMRGLIFRGIEEGWTWPVLKDRVTKALGPDLPTTDPVGGAP